MSLAGRWQAILEIREKGPLYLGLSHDGIIPHLGETG
jgi:hypothetical protein